MILLRQVLLIHTVLVLGPALSSQTPHPLLHYGSSSCGSSNFMPTFHTEGELPYLNCSTFKLVSRNLRGGAPGVLFFSIQQANLPLMGATLLVNPTQGVSFSWLAGGAPGQAGVGTANLPLPIPNLHALVGCPLFLQAFFIESAAPLSLAHTQGIRLTIAAKPLTLQAALHDRKKYQQTITSAPMGKALWLINAVPGFTYVKTEKYSCGGQSHWMVIVKDQKYNIEFVLIPGGSYRMGDITGNGGSYHQYEVPVHWVNLQPFLLAQTELSQAQWYAVMGNKPWLGRTYYGPNSDCAASYITYNDAAAFCTRTGWRMPSEAEWEYACRAGTTTTYPFGNDSNQLDTYAWTVNNTWNMNLKSPQPVGKKPANAFGLRDIIGNVIEWVEDQWQDTYNCAPTDGRAWVAGSSPYYVFRGGCWWFYTQVVSCQSAYRWGVQRDKKFNYIGFRPALSLR